ncbi:hypothetical protein [Pseudomonas sp. E102]
MTFLNCSKSNPQELVVERAKPLRFAESNGSHDEILSLLAGYRPAQE